MVEKRKISGTIMQWLKNPYNLILIGIVLVAVIIRLKYYNINMGIWWDEGEYLLKAKNWAFGTPMKDYWNARPVTLSLLWALLFKLGANETIIRFVTELLPSVGTVVLMYLLGKEMYNEKIGLIAASMMSVFWLHIFFTARLLMDLPGLFFALAAMLFFWKGFVKKQGNKFIYLTAVFTVLTALTKYNDGIIIFIFAITILILERLEIFKNKKMWKAIGVCIIIFIIPYMLFNYLSFGDPLPAITTYILTAATSAIQQFDKPAWYIFDYFHEFLFTFWLIIFFIGLATLWRLFLGVDLLLKRKDTKLIGDLFCILLIVLPLIFFVFIYKFGVHQYLFLMTPGMFLIMAKGVTEISHLIEKYNKYLGIAIIIVIVGIGAYTQLVHAHNIIENKKTTYAELKQAGIWIKENSNKDDKVMITNNEMEFAAYAEIAYINEGDNQTDFEEILVREKPKYIVLALFVQNEEFEWIIPLLSTEKERFVPVQAWFADKERKQARVVIYKVVASEKKGSLPIIQ